MKRNMKGSVEGSAVCRMDGWMEAEKHEHPQATPKHHHSQKELDANVSMDPVPALSQWLPWLQARHHLLLYACVKSRYSRPAGGDGCLGLGDVHGRIRDSNICPHPERRRGLAW